MFLLKFCPSDGQLRLDPVTKVVYLDRPVQIPKIKWIALDLANVYVYIFFVT